MFPLPLSILGPAIAIGLLAIACGVQTVRLSNCKADAAELSAQYKILTARTEEQNAKVSEFETKAKQAQEKGRKAVQQAAGAIQAAKADRDRLEAELAARGPKSGPVACGDLQKAVASVRAGLK